MPFGNGTGPAGQGSGRRQPGTAGRGRQPAGFGLGPGGNCVCPACGARAPHQRGVPCYQHKCPQCGQPMTRAGISPAGP